MNLTLTDDPASSLPFHGIGLETDCFIFDDANRQCGVNDKDLDIIERRLRALQPAISRMFVCIDWFNPSRDGQTFDWAAPYYAHLVRQLRILESMGTRVNLVLFSPHPPEATHVEPLIDAMIALLRRLRDTEGLRLVSWVTLYNEPDSLYLHDSPLVRAVFPSDKFSNRPPFSEYVRLNRHFLALLKDHGLYPDIRLIVADTVWGYPMRVERLNLCREAFADVDVDFSYHNYSSEESTFYDGNPNFAYPGMAKETQLFRQIIGPGRELILWEFNAAAQGFGAFFPGIGPHGTDMLSSFDAAITVSDKVMTVIGGGINGVCLWCFHDMLYLDSHKSGAMGFGLFRFKWQGWHPRPYYHYYALLCRSFRPGSIINRIEGTVPGITALAATQQGHRRVALLNSRTKATTVSLHANWPDSIRRLRVYPSMIPTEGDLPATLEDRIGPSARNRITVDLEPGELMVLEE